MCFGKKIKNHMCILFSQDKISEFNTDSKLMRSIWLDQSLYRNVPLQIQLAEIRVSLVEYGIRHVGGSN